MNPVRSYLNLRFLPSTRSANASSRKSQTSLLGVLALCAAILAGSTPVYPASVKAGPASPGSGAKMAPTITPEEAAAKHETLKYAMVIPDGQADQAYFHGYWTAYPYVRKYLTAYVVYNAHCQEVTAGNWYLNYSPTYGVPSQGLVTGRLSNGDCPRYVFRSRAIYYTWVYDTNFYQNDVFEATWRGAGFHHQWVFYMRDR
jgi:hypothetical protein